MVATVLDVALNPDLFTLSDSGHRARKLRVSTLVQFSRLRVVRIERLVQVLLAIGLGLHLLLLLVELVSDWLPSLLSFLLHWHPLLIL